MLLRMALFVITAVIGFSVGCTFSPNTTPKPDRFVGNYMCHSDNTGLPYDPALLTLRSDGKYVVIHMPEGKPGSREEGTWQLLNDPSPRIKFGNRIYPIRISGRNVRLLIDDDLDWYYERQDDRHP